MTEAKILEVVAKYKKHPFLAQIRNGKRHRANEKVNSYPAFYSHMLWMCNEVEKFVSQGRKEKAFRWLGFIQGCLWMNGDYTLSQLANHNRLQIKKSSSK